MIRRLITVLLTLPLAGCAGFSPLQALGDWLANAQDVEALELARSLQCGTEGEQEQLHLFRDASAFERWREQRGVELGGFERAGGRRILVIEYGRKPTAGYHVAVSRVARLRGSELTVHATFLSPRPDAMVAQVLTTPCVVVAVPDHDYRKVRVLDQDGRERAVWWR